MKLYGTYTSPYTRIVRIMALEVGLGVPLIEMHWRKTPNELFEVNPRGRIPVLLDGLSCICESRTIVEYLWEKVTDTRQVSSDLRKVAGNTRWQEESVLSDIYGALESGMLIRALSTDPSAHQHPYVARSRERITHCFQHLDSVCARGYLVEQSSFGLAEAALIAAADTFEMYKLSDISLYANINIVRTRSSDRASVSITRPHIGQVESKSPPDAHA